MKGHLFMAKISDLEVHTVKTVKKPKKVESRRILPTKKKSLRVRIVDLDARVEELGKKVRGTYRNRMIGPLIGQCLCGKKPCICKSPKSLKQAFEKYNRKY